MKKHLIVIRVVTAFFAAGCVTAQTAGQYLGDIGEVVVYGERRDIASTVSELNGKDLVEIGVRNVSGALELVAGADVQTASKGAGNVSLRGFEQRSLKVLIDGVPAYEGFWGLVDLSAIPTESIEKIIVTKGASSVLYGANTMGGVVNIITKKGTEEGKTNFSSFFGSHRAKNYILSRSARLGKFNYYLSYSRRSSDGFRLPGDFNKEDEHVGENSEYVEDGGIRELSDYEKQALAANFGFRPDESTRANLSASYFKQERGCLVSMFRYWRFSGWDQGQINLAVERKLSPAATVKTRIFYVGHSDEVVDDAARTIAAGGKSWFDKSRYNDFSTGGEIHSHFDIGRRNLLRIGLNYQKDQNRQKEYNAKNKKGDIIVPGWGDEETYEVNTYCAGVEDSFRLGDKISFVFGAGYDYFNPVKYGSGEKPEAIRTINPQAGTNFNVAENTVFYASVGKKTRFPTMKELYSKHAGGNPNIKKQTTIASEISIRQKFGLTANFSAAFFHNKVSDLIESVNKVYVNIGAVEMYGAEMEVNASISSRLNVKGNYTYLRAKEKKDENGKEVDRWLAQRPEHKLNLIPLYNFSSGLSVGVPFSYAGRQRLYNPERKTSDYFLVNIKIAYRLRPFETLSPEIFAEVNNVFDRNYEEGDGPMPGRNFLAGLKLAF